MPRSAHQRITARTAYSVRCAHLRAMKTTVWTVSSEAWGNSQRTIGSMIREERWTDFESPEAETMTTDQSRTGSQYLANDLSFDTAHRKPRHAATGNAKPPVNNSGNKTFDPAAELP